MSSSEEDGDMSDENMSELSAAQLVERLRGSYGYRVGTHYVADFIDKQAEQIVALTNDLAQSNLDNETMLSNLAGARRARNKAKSEVAALWKNNDKLGFDLREVWRANAALWKAIEEAPHGDTCNGSAFRIDDADSLIGCACWKANYDAAREAL